MAEPPAKRAKRIDSSTMWDVTDKHSNSKSIDGVPNEADILPRRAENSREEDINKVDSRRRERRHRSRSRDRDDRRWDRSRSRERRNRDYTRDNRRDIDRNSRNIRGRDRSISKDRQSSRRDYGSKPARYRERSRSRSISSSHSPTRNGRRRRTRSPPRGPRPDRKDITRHGRYQNDSGDLNGMSDSKRHSTRDRGYDDMELDDNVDPDDLGHAMMKTMGFSSFRSTQNTKVPGNNISGVRKERKSEYRQYMNRTGGFNRPLSPSR